MPVAVIVPSLPVIVTWSDRSPFRARCQRETGTDTFPAAVNDGLVALLGFDRSLQTLAVNTEASVELEVHSMLAIQANERDRDI